MIVGYLGPVGSFSDAMAQELFAGKPCEFKLFESLHLLQEAALNKKVDIAVMPFFNSKEGAIKNPSTGKEFIHSLPGSPLKIVAENFIELKFLLVAKQNTRFEDIKHVHVNPYAENLCRKYLEQYPFWNIVVHSSSSAAAASLLTASSIHAALASKQAAEQYELTILDENTLLPEDISIMHFLAVSAEPAEQLDPLLPKGNTKVHAYLLPLNSDILSEIKALNITIANARPIGNDQLYIEVTGQIDPDHEHRLLHHMHAQKLGCYAADVKREGYQQRLLSDLMK